ncbi:MAG: galactoside ABC transporter permease [Clostridia bacterium]|nr:galactoside ABC transporter permease [Clostridia bacterium]
MSIKNGNILSAEAEQKLLAPIDEFVGNIQQKINALRADGTDQVIALTNHMAITRENANFTKGEKADILARDRLELAKAKNVEKKNKAGIKALIDEAEAYLNANYDKEYYSKVAASCEAEKTAEEARYAQEVESLKKQHEADMAKLTNAGEIKDEKYVFKNKLFDARLKHDSTLQTIKDRQHEAFTHRYHLIDLLRLSRFTWAEKQAQKWENYKYTFSVKQFLLKNGLYIAIVFIFILLCILTPVIKHTQLLTMNNVLNILQVASPRMFLALGVGGLILLGGTDLSVGRMVGTSMVLATMIMHKGINTGALFGNIFDFTALPLGLRIVMALVVCCCVTTAFTSLAGFFTARFKIHPFISTMANMLIMFGLMTFATKGVSFGAIELTIPKMIIPKLGGQFPTIILWAVAAIIIMYFIWNKTKLGKYMYAVGGNQEAAAVSGISVFKITIITFIIAGILYGFGAWLECIRMVGSGSASYGQGWETDAIAACVVGGISFKGGIGKIQGIVVGVLIFTALTYSLTILGVDTNLQFVFSGIIILSAVTIDCLKYVQKK